MGNFAIISSFVLGLALSVQTVARAGEKCDALKLPALSGSCGDKAKESPIYKAIDGCRSDAAAKDAGELVKEAHLAGGQATFCQMGVETGIKGGELDEALCKDPGGYVCDVSGGKGTVLTSKCQLSMVDAKESKNAPGSIAGQCAFDVASADIHQKIYDDHKEECITDEMKQACDPAFQYAIKFPKKPKPVCPPAADPGKCRSDLESKYAQDISSATRGAIYSSDRIARLEKFFKRVKAKYLEMLDKTTLLDKSKPEQAAKIEDLKKLINDTELALKPHQINSPLTTPCTEPGPDGLSTAISNTHVKDVRRIFICAGVMANLESSDPYALMNSLAHELGHSIDPCELEERAWSKATNDDMTSKNTSPPDSGEKYFPNVAKCLRGGAGDDGCGTGTKLGCTTKDGVKEECLDYAKVGEGKTPKADCERHAAATPSCKHGLYLKDEPGRNRADAGTRRAKGAPLSQMGESFADFIGAEVMGEILKEDSDAAQADCPGPIDVRGKRDALIAIASENARLHGVCARDPAEGKNLNGLDEHPIGYLRTNRLMMGSLRFRKAIGCGTTVPKEGVDKCQAF